jgi:hypothetical protein
LREGGGFFFWFTKKSKRMIYNLRGTNAVLKSDDIINDAVIEVFFILKEKKRKEKKSNERDWSWEKR